MRSNLWKYSPAAILLIFAASGGLAQMTTAEIAGSVRDPQGLAMPAVPVSAVNQKSGSASPERRIIWASFCCVHCHWGITP